MGILKLKDNKLLVDWHKRTFRSTKNILWDARVRGDKALLTTFLVNFYINKDGVIGWLIG